MYWFGSGWYTSYTGISPHKLINLQHDTSLFVARGYASGLEVSALVGRWTWAALVARPALSVFNAVYRFIECARNRPFTIWRSVIRELEVISGLSPLLYTSLSAPVASRVIASDASEIVDLVCAREYANSDFDLIAAPPAE